MTDLSSHNSYGPKDRQRVDVDRQQDCVWWSNTFGVSVEELRAAVKEVGPRVAYLDRYLLDGKSAA